MNKYDLGSFSDTDLTTLFHLDVLGTAGHGWSVSDEVLDLMNDGLHVYAKIVDDSTLLAPSTLRKARIVMQAKALEDRKAVCCLVDC